MDLQTVARVCWNSERKTLTAAKQYFENDFLKENKRG